MLATVVRSGMVEAWHDGAVAVVDPAGHGLARSGDVDRQFFIRSVAKPVQAATVVALGARLTPEETAVVAGSHYGEPAHVGLVGAVLHRHHLDDNALACPPAWPLSTGARQRVIGVGHTQPRRIWHNCSGKHAGMVAACTAQGWQVDGYLDAGHPLQRRIAAEMGRVFGGGTDPSGIDGCGAPVFRCSAASVARGFARLLDDAASASVISAISRFPALASGQDAVDTAVAVALGGFAKRGAEGLLAVGLPGRGALAVKVWDGSARPTGPVAAAVLDRMGWIPDGARDALECGTAVSVFGGPDQVGSVTPAVELESW